MSIAGLDSPKRTVSIYCIMDLARDLCDEIVLLSHGVLEVVEKSNLDNQGFKEEIITARKEESYA